MDANMTSDGSMNHGHQHGLWQEYRPLTSTWPRTVEVWTTDTHMVSGSINSLWQQPSPQTPAWSQLWHIDFMQHYGLWWQHGPWRIFEKVQSRNQPISVHILTLLRARVILGPGSMFRGRACMNSRLLLTTLLALLDKDMLPCPMQLHAHSYAPCL